MRQLDALRADLVAEERGQENLRRLLTDAQAELAAAREDAERYRFWRKFYDCRFALKLASMNLDLQAEGYAPPVTLSFTPSRPQIEIAENYERLVDAAIDAAREGDR